MYKRVKLPHGISTVSVGNVDVTTINLRVKDSFPIKRVPKEVICCKVSNDKTGKEYYQMTYSAVSDKVSRRVVKKIGILLREHAQAQLDAKYAWVDIFNN
jgi:hypothetical protein